MEYRIIGDDGREYGPVGLDGLREWARGGRVSVNTMVLRSDTGRWAHAAHYEELEGYVREAPGTADSGEQAASGADALPAGGPVEGPGPGAVRSSAPQPAPSGQPSGQAWNAQYHARYQMPGRGGTVLALGIVSLLSATLFSCVCLGIFIAPVAGIAAWIMGAVDLRKIDGGLIPPHERSFTRAGMICGIIGTFLGPFLGVAALVVSVASLFADLVQNFFNGW